MVPDVRSLGGNLGGEFDVNSPAGVVAVLAAIRSSEVSQEKRNELRDLVFLYTRGNDEAVKSSLLSQLADNKVVPAVSSSEIAHHDAQPSTEQNLPVEMSVSEVKVQPKYVQSRPVPRFVPPVIKAVLVETAPLNVPIATPSAPAMQTEVVPLQPEPVIEPLVVVAPSIIETHSVPVAPVEVQAPAVPEVEVAPVASVSDVDVRTARIQSIKSAVNKAVGNPVNLVDIDNTLGREYMSALLEAMKLAPNASGEVVTRAMERLETVFRLVEAKVEMINPGSYPPLTKVVPLSSSQVVTENVTANVVVPVTPLTAVGSGAPTRIIPIPVRVRDEVITPAPDALVPEVEALQPVSSVQFTEVDLAPIVTVDATIPAEPIADTPKPMRSVADTPILKTLADLPTADALERSSVEGDDLFTKDVDDGLDQLLSEWSLFKKSGMFGTGPKGHLHPLFIKLAGLQIPLIMSGRFEGSSEEIKQSISDYMNGWRYEQGIIFENNETFEHYLRRVIRHILNLQKKRRSP